MQKIFTKDIFVQFVAKVEAVVVKVNKVVNRFDAKV